MLFLLQLTSTSFSDGFHLEEKLLNKKKLFPLAIMKDFVEIDVSTRQKNYQYLLIMISNSSKIALTKKNTVSSGRTFVCTSQIKNIEKYASVMQNHSFHFKNMWKVEKNGVH